MKYEDYKRFGDANSKILYQGKEIPKDNVPPDQKKPENNPNSPQK